MQKVFELLGDSPAQAKQNAATVMRMETGLAKASLTRVERRDPYKQKHKMSPAELGKIAPDVQLVGVPGDGAGPERRHRERRRGPISSRK